MILWFHEMVTWQEQNYSPTWAVTHLSEQFPQLMRFRQPLQEENAEEGHTNWPGCTVLSWSTAQKRWTSEYLLFRYILCSTVVSIDWILQLSSTYFFLCSISPLLVATVVVSSFMICLVSKAGKEILHLMWEHFLLCIKEPSANLQNTNKVSGCARTPAGKPGTNSAWTASRSAVFILECTALCVSFIFGYFSSIFSFYWSKFSIVSKL